MAEKLLSRLKSNLEFFSNVEKKIANLILADPKKFITYSMTELADRAEISQGSIINFAKKFAGGGFPALKLKIAAGLAEYEERPFSVVDKDDTVKDAFSKTIGSINGALKNTYVLNDEKLLQRVADRILKAKKVEIYGIWRSAVVATDFYYQLLHTGINASFASDILTCALSASMLDSDSLVIAVSSSGRTKDIIDIVKNAKENGVPVVSITSNPDSPLAKISDDVLTAVSSGNSVTGSSTEVRFSQLALTDALCSYLRTKTDENAEKRYFEYNKILNSHNVND